MVNAKKQFSESELLEIETAIIQAEERTSAEIVVAVSTESGRYDRGECHFGVVVSLLALVLFNLLNALFIDHELSFFEVGLPFYWQLAVVVAGYVVGIMIASLNIKMRMLLGTPEEVEQEVAKGARLVFLEEVLSSQRLGGAVLIYLSLAECRVAVMVDDRIKSAMGKNCNDLVTDTQNRIVRLIGEGRLSHALSAGVDLLAGRLEKSVPYREDNVNELPNHVVLIHPRP